MAKLSLQEQTEATHKVGARLERLRQALTNRQLLYDLRRGYFDGTIRPTVERDHDLIYTQYAHTIVEKFAAYFMGNGFSIKFKPEDVSDPEQLVSVQALSPILDKLYNDNDSFIEQCYKLGFVSGEYGDGYLDTEVVDGAPIHKSIMQPHNIMLDFRDDNYSVFDAYAYEKGLSIEYIKEAYGVDAQPMPMRKPSYASGAMNTHRNPFADSTDMSSQNLNRYEDNNLAKVTVFTDFLAGERTQLINNVATHRDSKLDNLYHLTGNENPGTPYGDCDFETVAHIITKAEEKLSEESDAVAQSTHIKLITDQDAKELTKKYKPYKTQVFQVSSTDPTKPGRIEVLNTNANTYPSKQLVDTLMNTIRSSSGLQELGQDQIAANVSGRAIAYMFQGVQQKIKTKRLRFSTLIRQMVIDDFEILAKSDPSIKELAFDKQGKFKLKISVKYPAVLEQDEQVRISNIQLMRQGTSPLISDYSARLLLTDYIDDPLEEEQRIKKELDQSTQRRIDEAKAIQAASQPTAPTAAPATETPQEPQSLDMEEMEPGSAVEGTGTVSTEGAAGTAQQSLSAPGVSSQMLQQTTPTN